MTEIMREMIVRSEKLKHEKNEQYNTDHPTETWKSQK